METHAVNADRVVNIDEMSCRLLLVHQIGWGRCGANQARLQGNAEKATTITIAFSIDRAPLDMPGADRARRQDRRRLARAARTGAHSSRHVRERLGDDGHDPAARGHSGQRAAPEQGETGVDPSLGHGQHPHQ